ncbi:MAG TPA: substrate-binding domain-containing protein [Solirubrobacterales bacterium]|nr:substrate-binding domain-containing protein [Solirubrobacterales bacterium]
MAVSAGSAAALGEQCSGSNVRGLGAFLQYRAQVRWGSSNELGFNGSSSPYACNGSQGAGGKPEVSYTPTDSATALRAWGAQDGARHEEAFGFPVRFLGTDIAPAGPVGEEGSMLNKMHSALGSDVVVVPVTQTAIAIVSNPPALPGHAACAVPRINATQLQKVFSGEIKNWRQLSAASDSNLGGDCDQAITRVAREESAGTTYQFKHYLDQVNPAPLPCTGKTQRTWSQLQAPFDGEAPANTEWPRSAGCQEGEGPVTTVAKGGEGEAGPLQFVANNHGTITYASLPEAEDKAPKQIIELHNGAKFVSPETESGAANCGAAKYPLPEGFEKGINVDWSQVYGSNPKIGEAAAAAYPICTLTWDVVPANAAGLFGGKVATTLRDYLRFLVFPEGGGAGVRSIGYQDLPGYVAEAGAIAINQIGGEEKPEEEEEKEEEPPLSSTGTVLCNVQPEYTAGTLACPGGQQFTSQEIWGSVIEPSTFQSTSGPKLTVTCNDGWVAGTFKADGTTVGGGLAGMAFKGCETSLPESPEAYLYLEGTPYDAARFVYIGGLAPQGALALARQGGGDVFLVLQGLGEEACSYRATFLSSQMVNGTPSRLVIQGTWELNGGAEEVCPLALQESAQTTLQWAEGPLYIAGQ